MRKISLTLMQKALVLVWLVLLPVMVTFFYSYEKNREHLEDLVLNNLIVVAEAYEGQVYLYLEQSMARAVNFSTDGKVVSLLKQVEAGNSSASNVLVRHLRENKLPVHRSIRKIIVVSDDGRVVGSTSAGDAGRRVTNERFFVEGRTASGITAIGIEGGLELASYSPIKDGTDGRVIGVMVVFSDISDLSTILSGEFAVGLGAVSGTRGRHETMEVYIVDGKRRMITPSIFVNDAAFHQGVDSMPVKACLDEKREAQGIYPDYRGIPVAGASMCLPKIGWVLLVEVDEAEVLAPVVFMRRDASIAFLFVSGLIGLLFFLFYRGVVVRLKTIAGAAGRIALGDYSVVVPVKEADEIDSLATAFNAMSIQIAARDVLIRDSEARLRAIIDNSGAVIYSKDTEGRYLLVNRRFEELFRRASDDIYGRTDLEIFGGDTAVAFMENDRKVVAACVPMEFEETVMLPDGLHYYISVKFPLVDVAGRPFAVGGILTDITERKRMEEAVRLSETKYRTLVTNIPDVTWTSADDGSIAFISSNISAFGYTPEEFYSSAELWFSITHPDDAASVKAGFKSLMEDGTPFNEEYRVRARDGRWVWVHDRATSTYVRDGQRYADGVFTDISARKSAEMRIERLNRLYSVLSKIDEAIVRIRGEQSLYASACRIAVESGGFSQAMVVMAEDGAAAPSIAACFGDKADDGSASCRCMESEGCPAIEAIKAGKSVVYNDIATEAPQCEWATVMLGHGYLSVVSFPIIVAGRAIGAFSLLASEAGFFDEDQLRLIESVATDISFAVESMKTERQAASAEAGRMELQKRYEGLVNNLAVGIYRETPDKAGRFIEVNAALVKMLGAPSKEDLMARDPSAFFIDRAERERILARVMQEGFVKGEEAAMMSLDGHQFWASVTAVMKRDDKGVIYIDGIMEDVTERRKLEEQLRHSQKLEAVGQLAGGIAHDFNNILTAIIGYGNLLLMKKGSDEFVRNYSEHILTLSEKATALTQGMLSFSRKQVMNLVPFDINDLVRRAAKILERVIGEDIKLHAEVEDRELIVRIDPSQIEQVLMNLLSNARDAMPSGGVIEIRTDQVRLGREYEERHGYGTSGDYACITVSDTGEGMDEATRERIFEPFFTTKEVGKGTGLGLSIVYGIIMQHEGFIDVYSEPGTGTTFRVYLPLSHEGLEAGSFSAPEESVGGTETILLAEDDTEVRTITTSMLTEFGYTVIEALDGNEAVEKFAEKRDTIKLVILDMIMPKKNGKEAYDAISAMAPGTKVIFMSGYASEMMKVKGILDTGMDFMTKPVSPRDFLMKIREVLDR